MADAMMTVRAARAETTEACPAVQPNDLSALHDQQAAADLIMAARSRARS